MPHRTSLSLDQKRGVLMNRLNALVVVATILFALLDFYLGIKVGIYVYIAFIGFTSINAFLIHRGFIDFAKVFGLLIFNVMIFLLATSEPFTTGMHLHYVTTGAVALALYGYEQWKWAILFVALSLTLDILTFTIDRSFIPWRDVDIEQARVFFVLNTMITASICVYTFMMYSKINYESEKSLQQNEKIIRLQNEELLKTNAELDRFVYSASHDLRSPLSTLTGLINLSKIETDDQMKLEYLDLMKSRVKSMDAFISEIIDYSRNSRLEVNQTPINLKDLLFKLTEELRYATGAERMDLLWEMPHDLVIYSDESRLKIVFSNLISNAIKYQDLEKELAWIKLKAAKNDAASEVDIVVEDNGIGIDEELRHKVYDMFFRAHDHSTGSGLGLYIVKETLMKLSGKIMLESTVGLGSKFKVTLPYRVYP